MRAAFCKISCKRDFRYRRGGEHLLRALLPVLVLATRMANAVEPLEQIATKPQAVAPVQNLTDSGLLKYSIAGFVVLVLVVMLAVILKDRKQRPNPITVKPKPRTNPENNLGNSYRALFENANDLIVGTALDGRLLYVNDAWKETLDFNDGDIASSSIFRLVHSESLENFRYGFQRAAA